MDLELEGRVALVTGASRGLGEQIALALAAEGCDVVAIGRSAEDLERVVAAAEGGTITPMVADVADHGGLDRLVEEIVARHGRLDLLVNNAGIAPAGAFAEQPREVWERVFAVNVIAPMALAQACGRHFLSRGAGKIINVASTTGVRGKPHLVAYSASKGALVRMTEALAAEWAGSGIQVNAIAPGAFATDAQSAVLESSELLARRVRRIPAKRMGEPEEIAALACLLASPRSDFVNGAVYVIDGGEAGKL